MTANGLLAIDTNAYRALDDGNETIAAALRSVDKIGIPVTVLGEIYYGIFLGSRSQENNLQLQRFQSNPRVEILHITEQTAKLFGEISADLRRRGKPIQQNDIWIAAICKEYGYELATNDADFTNVIGLDIVKF